MLLTYDLDRAKWVTAPGTASPPAKPHFIRRDTPPISVQFCRGATVVEVGVAPTWRFGIKALGGFSGSYLTSTAAATLSGSGTTAVYAFAPSFNTGAIDTALPTDTKLVEGALEIEITVGAQVTSTVALPCVIDNDYNQGGESPTTSGALAYPATYLTTFTAYTGGGALALDSLAITTADVGRIFSLIGSADPAFPEAVISFWRVYAGTDAAVAGAVVRATNYTGAGVYACVFQRVG